MKSLPGTVGPLSLLAAATLAAACSSSPLDKPTGSIGLNLVPVAGIEINSVHYVVTGTPAIAGTPLPAGDLPTPGTASTFSFGIPIPVGTGYTLSLTAQSANPNDDITCTGSYAGPNPPGTGFSVQPRVTLNFTMVLTCVDNTNGQVISSVDVETDACPRLHPTWVTATPYSANVGDNIALSALGSDLDGATISYAWSIPNTPASVGVFTAPTSQATTFACAGPADDFIARVTMDNGECTKDLDTIISCTSVTCGNTVLDAGEDCDPVAPVGAPGYNPYGCPSDCTVQCGDGSTAEAPTEECEIGVGGSETAVCTADCRLRPLTCGDGWFHPLEACDPTATPTGAPPGAACTVDCTVASVGPTCGDGVLGGTEACEAAISTDSRGCGTDCQFIFSSQCQSCIEAGCTGADTCQGGGFSSAQSAQCNALLDCVDDSGCNSGGFPLFCYCGPVTATQCDQGQAAGACRSAIEQGLSSTDPGFIQNNLFDIALPAGRAMARFECGNGAGCGTLCQ